MKSLIEVLEKTIDPACDTCKKAIKRLKRINNTRTVNGMTEFTLTIWRNARKPDEIHIGEK